MSRPVDRRRRHTLHFLRFVRSQSPIFMDTDVDMSAVLRHRATSGAPPPAYVSYVVHAVAQVLRRHPEANASMRGVLNPRLVRHERITAKVAFDKTLDATRVVLSGLIPETDRKDLAAIDRLVRYYRDGDPAQLPEFAGPRALHRLPVPVGGALFRLAVRDLEQRETRLGTFSVSSLGHRNVNGFYPLGGTALSFGAGRIRRTPVVVGDHVTDAPTMRLTLVFDHRILDGAPAADILDEVRGELTGWPSSDVDQVAAGKVAGDAR